MEYIYLNPVRAGLVKHAEDWQWSSVHDYTGGLSAGVSGHGLIVAALRGRAPTYVRRELHGLTEVVNDDNITT